MLQKVSVLASTDNAVAVESSYDVWEWILRVAIVLGLALIIYATVAGKVFNPLVHAAHASDWMHAMLRPSILWLTMGSLLLGFRTFLWFRYRPFAAATMADAPALTVIIPAFNEGAMVAQTIDSVAAARLPRFRAKRRDLTSSG